MKSAMVESIQSLKRAGDRGALAALRSGLGQPNGVSPRMYSYVIPYVPNDSRGWVERSYFIVAGLFASHPGLGVEGCSVGRALRQVAQRRSVEAVERRFIALLESRKEDVPHHLRHIISLVASEEVDLDWSMLLQHLHHWDHPDQWVQRRWARDFWGAAESQENTEERE